MWPEPFALGFDFAFLASGSLFAGFSHQKSGCGLGSGCLDWSGPGMFNAVGPGESWQPGSVVMDNCGLLSGGPLRARTLPSPADSMWPRPAEQVPDPCCPAPALPGERSHATTRFSMQACATLRSRLHRQRRQRLLGKTNPT